MVYTHIRRKKLCFIQSMIELQDRVLAPGGPLSISAVAKLVVHNIWSLRLCFNTFGNVEKVFLGVFRWHLNQIWKVFCFPVWEQIFLYLDYTWIYIHETYFCSQNYENTFGNVVKVFRSVLWCRLQQIEKVSVSQLENKYCQLTLGKFGCIKAKSRKSGFNNFGLSFWY